MPTQRVRPGSDLRLDDAPNVMCMVLGHLKCRMMQVCEECYQALHRGRLHRYWELIEEFGHIEEHVHNEIGDLLKAERG